jgi:hypothetical protein
LVPRVDIVCERVLPEMYACGSVKEQDEWVGLGVAYIFINVMSATITRWQCCSSFTAQTLCVPARDQCTYVFPCCYVLLFRREVHGDGEIAVVYQAS